FTGDVPLRSRFGNGLTRVLFRALVGQGLTDTQTGLRGIPREFITTLLRLDSSGYEFELDMLLACKHAKRQILETPIRTVYSEGNRSSHFNPLLDSMRIYFVLFRFLFASLITAAIDYTVFFAVYRAGFPLVASQAAARLVAMLFNYGAVKKMVFLSQRKHAEAFPRYALLVILSGTASYFLITVLTYLFDLPVIIAKATAEGLIFLANFAIQRDFIFTKKNKEDAATDWDRYYKQPFKAARLSRSVTEQLLIRLIDRYGASGKGELRIAELGGGNSCFYNGIVRAFEPCEYHVVDNNAIGLKKLKEREGGDGRLILHSQDVLNLNVSLQCDLVFSVGLIEHFSPDDTRKAIEAHFALLRPGGVAIISFPTPTFLYRGARWVAEFTRSWIFHDERPLCREEVAASLAGCGEVMFEKLNWPILLTQRVMVVRKRG
ncbi:MAG TPA: GtrA family protein, partial [Geobacteraceae bacterium]